MGGAFPPLTANPSSTSRFALPGASLVYVVVMGLVAAFVAYGRFTLRPLA